ncbi:cation:proton antiporter [Natranaerobius thermophilus]|uniref:Sodium/hydrogen exchanger n=1 Tax=Natranaerobius thermophilus (strain ATCC BAA-1301 / DSM 18059 / JW/NM-WN-LF) TaxID=457570 RepID=B2A4U6_NATTJ|nr:cation:proton antiporter [Natranaerobius thermophilus]ACB83868.1 sodium/hydrogen exchanger [Natranaerobius thermophilus JW/NM-WN-LF]
MIESILIILIAGFIMGKAFEKLNLPGLLGMLLAGILLGPNYLDLISSEILAISDDIRLLALILILLRAGLGLRRETLNKVGVLSLKLGSLPCLMEGFTVLLLAYYLFELGFVEAGILGFIIAAVSPAVIVPSMLKLKDRGLGKDKGIPVMILAGASIDDVFAITLISIFLGLVNGGAGGTLLSLLAIPREIIGGILFGLFVGFILTKIYQKFEMADSDRMVVLAVGALFAYVVSSYLQVAGLLAIMIAGAYLLEKHKLFAEEFSKKLKGVWSFGEIFLFVLIGSIVDVSLAISAGPLGILIITVGVFIRMLGVYISTLGSNLNPKERLFCGISYSPKATVQAAMGGVPLSMGLPGGELILALAVLSVIYTAPLGALGINFFADKLLDSESDETAELSSIE